MSKCGLLVGCFLFIIFAFNVHIVDCSKHLPLPPLFMKDVGSKAGEPSGLTYCNTTNRIYMNCDKSSCHYIYEFDIEGNFIQTLEFDSSYHDIEAIACDDVNKLIYIAQEGKRKVIGFHLDQYVDHHGQKQLIEVTHFSVVTENSVSSKSGLEGMTVNTKTGDIYVANEKSPVLLIHINSRGVEYATYEIPHLRDISGLAYDDQLDLLWILSDQMEKVYLTDLTGMIVYDSWDLPVYNPEGIAVNNLSDPPMLYVTTDPSAPGGKQYMPYLMGFNKPINGTGYSTYNKNHPPDYVTNPPPCSGCHSAFAEAVKAGFSSVEYWEEHFPEEKSSENVEQWVIITSITVPISSLIILLSCICVISIAVVKIKRRFNKNQTEEDILLADDLEMEEMGDKNEFHLDEEELFTN